jgi:hypothetical protein
MNKKIKTLVELAHQCARIGKDNQLVLGTITYFVNNDVKIGIYCADNYEIMSVYFEPLYRWMYRIEVSLYSEDIKIPYTIPSKELDELILQYKSFIDQNLSLTNK